MEVIQPQRLSEPEARALTNAVKGDAKALWINLLRLYEGGAHTALGYASWASYCSDEFEMSRTGAYQLLKNAQTVSSIMESTNGGLTPLINERQARELARVAPEHRAETWATVVRERGSDVTARDVRDVAQVFEAARSEPDGAVLIEQVITGNWDIPEVKKELVHRGVDWNPARRAEAEHIRESDDLILAIADPDELDRARLRLEFSKDRKYLALLCQLKPDYLAAVLNPNEIPGVRLDIRLTRAWLDALERAIEPRAGLRVVS